MHVWSIGCGRFCSCGVESTVCANVHVKGPEEADRWCCHSGEKQELKPAVLTPVISDREMGEQKPGMLDSFQLKHFVTFIEFLLCVCA